MIKHRHRRWSQIIQVQIPALLLVVPKDKLRQIKHFKFIWVKTDSVESGSGKQEEVRSTPQSLARERFL